MEHSIKDAASWASRVVDIFSDIVKRIDCVPKRRCSPKAKPSSVSKQLNNRGPYNWLMDDLMATDYGCV